jgi:DNA repair exonuclease SbcCD ATPase subunit
MSKTRKHSRRARGKKNLTTKERGKKEVAKEYKKIVKQISSLEKKIPKNEQSIVKLLEKGESSIEKLEQKKLKLQGDIEKKVEKKRMENQEYESLIESLSSSAEQMKDELSYSGLALL